MTEHNSPTSPKKSHPKSSDKLLASLHAEPKEVVSESDTPQAKPVESQEEPYALPPAAEPGSLDAPFGLPPARIPGSPEDPLGLPPNPSQWERLQKDRLSLGLMAAAPIALLALLLWLGPAYNDLPDLMPLHFDAQGNPDRIGARSEIWILPAIGLIVYLVNISSGLLLRLRFKMDFAANLLWGGAFMVQVLIWLTVWNITH